MAFDWKGAIKPAEKNSANKLSAAQKLVANMDAALAAYKAGNKDIKRPTIRLSGEEVVFSVRFANQALELAPGISQASVPVGQFEQVFAAIRESVLAGEFDNALEPLAAKAADRGRSVSASKRAAPKR